MSRFNTTSIGTKTVNLAGGNAHKQSPELELISILFTSFADDSFYEKANDTFTRLKELIKVCDKLFVAKAAIYARKVYGMRSITHVVASELAKYISGESWAKNFYSNIIHRPDDMMEIISYHKKYNGKIPNAMKKGIALSFDRFDKYSLAKYKGENKGVKLVDVVNIVHPVPVDKNKEAIEQLVKGTLASFDTWEVELSLSGQGCTSEEEKAEKKKAVWIKLITEKKIGYFALLRNLRNIIEQAPEIIKEVISQLTDETLIKKSLVFPFRYLSAYEEVQRLTNGKIVRDVLNALNTAVDISINNVPKFYGETLVVLDRSGSMNEYQSGTKSPHIVGALFSAVLLKSNNADFILFSDQAEYKNVNINDSTITISNSIRFAAGGTNFHSIFQTANKKYDRIIILSDMQGWIGQYTPVSTFNEYKKRIGANPFVYSFDLKGYGSMQIPESNVFCLAGFSDKVFDIMAMMEMDKNVLIGEINKVSL